MEFNIRFGFLISLMTVLIVSVLAIGLAAFAPIGTHNSDFSSPPQIQPVRNVAGVQPVKPPVPHDTSVSIVQQTDTDPDDPQSGANLASSTLPKSDLAVTPNRLKLALEEENDIEHILALLTHPDKAVRISTMRNINRLSQEIWQEKWHNPSVWLMSQLAPFHDQVAPAFLETLQQDTVDGNEIQNYYTIRMLMKKHDDVLPMMIWAAENHPSEKVRQSWMQVCVSQAPNEPRTKSLVYNRLRDSSPKVRRKAIEMLFILSI